MSHSVKVLAFAGAREAIGVAETSLPLPELRTAGAVLDSLCERFPKLAAHRRSVRLAVNGTYSALDAPVSPGDEVALIPPVAGG